MAFYVVAQSFGNDEDNLTIIGPFGDCDEAADWGQHNAPQVSAGDLASNHNWVVMNLNLENETVTSNAPEAASDIPHVAPVDSGMETV